ncbi:MAG: DUF3126 family protein [Sphingomonadales bacterium]|jgi:hypothetical protein
MNSVEISRVQKYLREKFDNEKIKLNSKDKTSDSIEVMLGDEFIGVCYRDEDEGEVSYAFHMAIIDLDLPD